MSLLFQRQRHEDFEVAWNGRAGDYLSIDLALTTMRFPPRQPSREDMDSLAQNGGLNRRGTQLQANGKTIQREQRLARGMCIECPNMLGKCEELGAIRCHKCRLKASEKQTKRYFKRRLDGTICLRCSRCKRKAREYGTWCRHCANAAGVIIS